MDSSERFDRIVNNKTHRLQATGYRLQQKEKSKATAKQNRTTEARRRGENLFGENKTKKQHQKQNQTQASPQRPERNTGGHRKQRINVKFFALGANLIVSNA